MGSSTSRHAWHEPKREAALWTGLLAGPIVWLALLETIYVMSYAACETRETWFLHLAVTTSFVMVAAAAYIAWRYGPPQDLPDQTPPVTRSTAEIRARWMALAGVGLSLWFMLVIVAMEIPIVVLKVCQ